MTTDQGFAIRRNGSCNNGYEIDCGQTAKPFHGCCPTGFQCPSQYNLACCPPGNNCTAAILTEPKCANTTWDLFDNAGYFCCEHGLPGYNVDGTDGCASPGYEFKGGEQILSTEQAGQVPSASSTIADSSSSSASTSTTAAPTNPPSSGGSSSSVGAIAGGVVGGVAALAALVLVVWYVLRRKRQERSKNPYVGQERSEVDSKHQLGGTQIHEADGSTAKYRHVGELPAQEAPAELAASRPLSP